MKKLITSLIVLTFLVMTIPVLASEGEKRSITTEGTNWLVRDIPTLEEAMRIAEERMGKVTVPDSIIKYDEIGNSYVEDITKEVDNVVIINRFGDYYLVEDIGALAINEQMTSFEGYIELMLHDAANSVALAYPERELVYINNVPWQNTEYKDYFVNEVKRLLAEGVTSGLSMLRNNDQKVWEVFLDPKHNGKAWDVLNSLSEQVQEGIVDEAVSEDEIIEENNQSAATEKSMKAVMKLGSNKVTIIENGKTKKTNQLSVSLKAVNGVTLIPLRGVLDELGAALNYDGKNVVIKYEDKEVILKNGSNIAMVNSKNVKMPAEVVIEKGRTLLPLRAVSEILGFKVNFDSKTNEIAVEKIFN